MVSSQQQINVSSMVPWSERSIRTFFAGHVDKNGNKHDGNVSWDAARVERTVRRQMLRVLLEDVNSSYYPSRHPLDVFGVSSAPTLPLCKACATSGCVGCQWREEHHQLYGGLLLESRFGWHLPGDTAVSNRLYDILYLGAVPLLVGEEMCLGLPFRHQVPWRVSVAIAGWLVCVSLTYLLLA